MKNIPVRTFGTALNEQSTITLLQQCLKVPPSGGFDFATMRARGRVADVLDKGGKEIVLEDADYATAVEAIKATRWAANEKYLLEFAAQFQL